MSNPTTDTNLAPIYCHGLFQSPLGYLTTFPIRALILVLLPIWGAVVLALALFMLTFGTIRKSS
jgi:hypothetical protein